MISVFQRQCKSFLHSWFFYSFCAAFLFALGVLILIFHVAYQYANVEYLLSYLTVAFSFLLPILTVPVFLEERNKGIARFVRSLPLSARDVVLGKYLSLLSLVGGLSLILLILPLLLSVWGTVYYPSAYMATFGFFLCSVAVLSMDVFFALVLRTPWVAFAVSYGVKGGLLALSYLSSHLPASIGAVVERLSVFGTFSPFAFGMVDLRAVGYYLSVAVLFFVLTLLCAPRLWKE